MLPSPVLNPFPILLRLAGGGAGRGPVISIEAPNWAPSSGILTADDGTDDGGADRSRNVVEHSAQAARDPPQNLFALGLGARMAEAAGQLQQGMLGAPVTRVSVPNIE